MVRSRHTVPHRRSRRVRQFGSPTGLLGGPEALIYQCLSLTSTRERGGLSVPRRNASTASAAPMRTDPLGVGVPHSHPATPFRSTQNSCSQKEGHDPPPSLAHQQCLEDRRRREVPSDFHDEVATRQRPRRTVLQRMLSRVHARIAVVATSGRLFPDSVQVLTKALVSSEHLRHPVDQKSSVPVQPNVPVWKDGLEDP